MKKRAGRFAGCCFWASFLLLSAGPALAWEGVVVNVQDGDTVLIAPQGAAHGDIGVRLYGIDAPELDQPGGTESREALQQLVRPGDTVKIVPLAGDRYNRVIGLLIRDENILNYEQIRTGQAWMYPRYCKARFCGEWRRAELAASNVQAGLWHAESPVPPWVWRKKVK